MRMKIIAPLSSSDRGRSAERIPIGSAISIQRTAPPRTSAAVTGTASPTISLTSRRFAYERPSEWSTTSRLRNRAYCSCTGRSSPSWCATRATSSAVADLPGREPRRVGRQEEEEDVRDERHAEEEDARPEESSCEVARASSSSRVVRGGGAAGAAPPLGRVYFRQTTFRSGPLPWASLTVMQPTGTTGRSGRSS